MRSCLESGCETDVYGQMGGTAGVCAGENNASCVCPSSAYFGRDVFVRDWNDCHVVVSTFYGALIFALFSSCVATVVAVWALLRLLNGWGVVRCASAASEAEMQRRVMEERERRRSRQHHRFRSSGPSGDLMMQTTRGRGGTAYRSSASDALRATTSPQSLSSGRGLDDAHRDPSLPVFVGDDAASTHRNLDSARRNHDPAASFDLTRRAERGRRVKHEEEEEENEDTLKEEEEEHKERSPGNAHENLTASTTTVAKRATAGGAMGDDNFLLEDASSDNTRNNSAHQGSTFEGRGRYGSDNTIVTPTAAATGVGNVVYTPSSSVASDHFVTIRRGGVPRLGSHESQSRGTHTDALEDNRPTPSPSFAGMSYSDYHESHLRTSSPRFDGNLDDDDEDANTGDEGEPSEERTRKSGAGRHPNDNLAPPPPAADYPQLTEGVGGAASLETSSSLAASSGGLPSPPHLTVTVKSPRNAENVNNRVRPGGGVRVSQDRTATLHTHRSVEVDVEEAQTSPAAAAAVVPPRWTTRMRARASSSASQLARPRFSFAAFLEPKTNVQTAEFTSRLAEVKRRRYMYFLVSNFVAHGAYNVALFSSFLDGQSIESRSGVLLWAMCGSFVSLIWALWTLSYLWYGGLSALRRYGNMFPNIAETFFVKHPRFVYFFVLGNALVSGALLFIFFFVLPLALPDFEDVWSWVIPAGFTILAVEFTCLALFFTRICVLLLRMIEAFAKIPEYPTNSVPRNRTNNYGGGGGTNEMGGESVGTDGRAKSTGVAAATTRRMSTLTRVRVSRALSSLFPGLQIGVTNGGREAAEPRATSIAGRFSKDSKDASNEDSEEEGSKGEGGDASWSEREEGGGARFGARDRGTSGATTFHSKATRLGKVRRSVVHLVGLSSVAGPFGVIFSLVLGWNLVAKMNYYFFFSCLGVAGNCIVLLSTFLLVRRMEIPKSDSKSGVVGRD